MEASKELKKCNTTDDIIEVLHEANKMEASKELKDTVARKFVESWDEEIRNDLWVQDSRRQILECNTIGDIIEVFHEATWDRVSALEFAKHLSPRLPGRNQLVVAILATSRDDWAT